MVPLEIWFNTATEPQTFAHVRSGGWLLGRVAELKQKIPAGTWLTLQPKYDAITRWLLRKGGWRYHGQILHGEEFCDLLRRED